MSTLHEIVSAKDGDTFISVGPVSVARQIMPKVSKGGRSYSTVFLKNASNEVALMLWDKAALVKLPEGQLSLRGKFVRKSFENRPSIYCEDLHAPDGATTFDAPVAEATIVKPTMKECLNAGLRAADYMIRKERPELAEAAFTFACNALVQGIKPE